MENIHHSLHSEIVIVNTLEYILPDISCIHLCISLRKWMTGNATFCHIFYHLVYFVTVYLKLTSKKYIL